MGSITGFMEISRRDGGEKEPLERLENFEEFHLPLSPQEQQRQGARCMDCGVPFCQSGMILGGMASGCPLNNLIPEWNDLIFQGKWKLALRHLLATNRFPEFTSRVCPALCEAACTCGYTTGEAVTVKENERAVIETAYAKGWMRPVPPPARTGKKVAVVGSGPSGLAAADLLNHRGHEVTVFERSDRPGGLLMYGIPNMKLDKGVVERRIRLMEAEGVTFRLNADVGIGVKADQLRREFDAVLLCCGAKEPRDLNVPGRDAKGIYFAVDFLSAVTKSLLDSGFADAGCPTAQGKKVLIIGGGDTGNDCVGTCLRQGCESVAQLEMMPQPPAARAPGNEWPEWPKVLKTDYGQQEAIARFGSDPRLYQATVKEFFKDEAGAVKGALVSRLAPAKDPDTGRTVMAPTGEEYPLQADLVLIAAGFLGCQSYAADAFGIERSRRGCVDTQGFATALPGVFAAGDMRRGQSLVVWALREGREAAAALDAYLLGYTNL